MFRKFMCWVVFLLSQAGASHGADLSGFISLPKNRVARDAVIYLEGGRKSSPLRNVVIDQRDKVFLPHVTVVTLGTTIEFPNNDTVLHNVFAYYNAKKFDLGIYARGEKKPQTFNKTGVVALLCNIHSEMSAYILVVDTPYYAVADSKGRFVIKGVPPGTYKLHGWHESGAKLIDALTVTDKDASLSLNLQR